MKRHRIRIGAAALGVALLTSVAAVGGAGASSSRASADKNIVETASDAGKFSTLISLAQRAGLAGTLSGPGPLTVFAPTDKAFERVPAATLQKLQRNRALLRSVLLYHVVPGNAKAGRVVSRRQINTVNGATIVVGTKSGGRVYLNRNTRIGTTNIEASNGTIHVIDNVLLPPNLVQVADRAGQFKTLTHLVKRAGLAGALSGSANLTVLAPTDKAFARVPRSTLRTLQRNPALLRKVLLYHVVPGNAKAAQVVKAKRLKTLNGATVRVGVKGNRVYLNRKSRVGVRDIVASNGTIHAIDNVLIPPAL